MVSVQTPTQCTSFTVDLGGLTAVRRQRKWESGILPEKLGQLWGTLTLKKDEYIRHLGYICISIFQCEWEVFVNANPSVKRFLKTFFSFLLESKTPHRD